MSVKLLTEHHLELLSLKGGCTGSSESHLSKRALLKITCHGSKYKWALYFTLSGVLAIKTVCIEQTFEIIGTFS